jgi:hypothetical protein
MEPPDTAVRPGLRSHWPLYVGILGLLWLHLPGWWGGQVYAGEDVVAQFYTLKSRLYLLAHGQERWSWWDPLWQLGTPRTANIQAGWLSPFSLWFAAAPPPLAWRLYPLLIDALLMASAYFFMTQAGCSRLSAGWAAAVWTWCGTVLGTSQQPCYKESLLAACLCLAFSLAYWSQPRRGYLVGLAISGGLHIAAGSPTAFFYDHLSLAFLLPAFAWRAGCSPRLFLQAGLAYASGFLLACAPWIAFKDYFDHGHRTLHLITGVEFAESFRLTAAESLRRLAGESHAWSPLRSPLRPGYPLPVDFSLAVTLLALSSLGVGRLRVWLGLSVFLSLQAMGERGGLLWLLHKLMPATLGVRGAQSFVVLASLISIWVAAQAWDHWRGGRPWHGRLCNSLALWAWTFPLLVQSVSLWAAYRPPETFAPPPWPPASGGRVMVLRNTRPRPPLIWQSLPVLHGIPTLVLPDSLYDKGYLQGLAYSQLGPDGMERVKPIFTQGGVIPIRHPAVPLFLSWGLTWVLQGEDGAFRWVRVQADPPRHWLTDPSALPVGTWASRREGDPYQQAHVETALPAGSGFAPVVVEQDQADFQRIMAHGPGLLVSNDQWDPGWQCRLDGKPVPALRANLAEKSCWIPPGDHQVEWRYQPPWLGKFALFHGAGWLLLLLTLVPPSSSGGNGLHKGLAPQESP